METVAPRLRQDAPAAPTTSVAQTPLAQPPKGIIREYFGSVGFLVIVAIMVVGIVVIMYYLFRNSEGSSKSAHKEVMKSAQTSDLARHANVSSAELAQLASGPVQQGPPPRVAEPAPAAQPAAASVYPPPPVTVRPDPTIAAAVDTARRDEAVSAFRAVEHVTATGATRYATVQELETAGMSVTDVMAAVRGDNGVTEYRGGTWRYA